MPSPPFPQQPDRQAPAAELQLAIANRQALLPIDEALLRRAVLAVLTGEKVPRAEISLAVVDDQALHELNRRYLGHDYPTDVLAFPLSDSPACLEGEIVVSAETALREALARGASPQAELVLYLVHGCLHLAGYDDQKPEDARQMRRREASYLRSLNLDLPGG